MTDFVFNLLTVFLSSRFLNFFFYLMIALAFLVCVPSIIRYIFKR